MHNNFRCSACVAGILRCFKLASLRQRIAHLTLLIIFAAYKALAGALTFMRNKLARLVQRRTHAARANHQIGLLIGCTRWVNALFIRTRTKRMHLNFGGATHTATRSVALECFNFARWHRIGYRTIRPAQAAHKMRPRFGRIFHHKVFAAGWAHAHFCISSNSIFQRLAHVIYVRNKRVNHRCQ